MALSYGGFSLRGGQLPLHDALDSPYSLFINGDGLSSMMGEFSFERGAFSYESRWIGLNHHNATGNELFAEGYYPERGANLKTYRLSFGSMSLGLQDAAVYSGRYFDYGYFINPMPNYFIQYVNGRSGRPWYNGYDDNDILGAFWTWEANDRLKLYTQILIDDFSVLGLLGTWSNNPWKAAWSLGADYDTPLGKFGFYQAGATKYCFEPTYETAGQEYGYSYYPDTIFKKGSSFAAIPFETLMLGYRHGENNLAFMTTWASSLGGYDLSAAFEFTVSGSKSPANAWQEETWTDYKGTRMLDEAVLEWKYLLTAGASKAFGSLLLFGQAQLGYVFNELELSPVTAVVTTSNGKTYPAGLYSTIEIWKPSDTNRVLYSLCLGGRYRLGL